MSTRVMVFGTFDCLHPGHEDFFTQARKHGDELYVIIARDNTVTKVKGEKPSFGERKRARTVRKLPMVTKVLLGNKTDKYSVIKKYQPNIICLGYDQHVFTQQLQSKLIEFNLNCKIIRLEPFQADRFKSSLIKAAHQPELPPQRISVTTV